MTCEDMINRVSRSKGTIKFIKIEYFMGTHFTFIVYDFINYKISSITIYSNNKKEPFNHVHSKKPIYKNLKSIFKMHINDSIFLIPNFYEKATETKKKDEFVFPVGYCTFYKFNNVEVINNSFKYGSVVNQLFHSLHLEL